LFRLFNAGISIYEQTQKFAQIVFYQLLLFMLYRYILHIDDDEDEQEIFFTALQIITKSVQYTAFLNAKKALHQLLTQQLTTDLIFLDLNMPEMNGQQFLYEIKKNDRLKTIPVIVFSTSSQSSDIAMSMQLGAHDFITKPDSFETLVFKLKTLLLQQ
jgi:CheY-like chemotaxis protein